MWLEVTEFIEYYGELDPAPPIKSQSPQSSIFLSVENISVGGVFCLPRKLCPASWLPSNHIETYF